MSNPSSFNECTPTFIERSSIHDLCSKQIASLIKKENWIQPTDSIMDFGCGVGSFTFILHDYTDYKKGLGVDSSENMIHWFDKLRDEKKSNCNIHSKCVFLENKDQLDGEKFDVIVSLKAMHHIPDPLQCVQLLKEYLNPNGSIILADLKLDDHSPQYHRSIKEPPCCHGFTEEYMLDLLSKAGFQSEVHIVNVVHYLECLDQEEAKKQYQLLPPYHGDICQDDLETLPEMIHIHSTYFEKSIFPFVVAYGHLSFVYYYQTIRSNHYNP